MSSILLPLKISVPEHKLVKTMQFPPDTLVIDVCRLIRDKLSETTASIRKEDQSKDFGLFQTDEDPKKGVWLENGRTLDYYMLRNGDVLEYKRKARTLRVRMLDGTVKTVLVDDSQNVANLMVVICTKIGISNHDEYSLVRETVDEKENSHIYSPGTLTLRRAGREKPKPVDPKMEQLKKKLKTDDDLNWVDHSLTLREQGIDEDETLLLRRKFFFSDQNIDSRDPVQLNLLYVQTRDAIIAGTHPVTVEEACQFAGLQCQIQFGDHIESKHRVGFLDTKEFLPKDYAKMKAIEKKIFSYHMKHAGLSDLEAKVEYVKLARSLKTYGVTFFLVKEKKRRKNKLVPRLIGVTKDSVLRLDEKTKEILKTWPLTAVKRWAASPNSFTLDFGDYTDSYYSVQTSEGEQIAQLIAGYIDIILKRKKAKDHFGIDGDEGSTMVEDFLAPYKANIMQHQTASKPAQPDMGNIALPTILRAASNGPQSIVTKEMPPIKLSEVKSQAHVGHTSGPLTPKQPQLYSPVDRQAPQRAQLFTTMKTSFVTIERVQHELASNERTTTTERSSLSMLDNDSSSSTAWKRSQGDVKRQSLISQLSAMNAATAKIISLTSVGEDEMDTPAIGAAVSSITSNLMEMTKDIRVLASLMEDNRKGDDLIEAAKNLCAAFSELLRAAEPGSKMSRQTLLIAASKVGETSQSVLTTMHESEEEEYIERETSKTLLGIAKNVANSTATLVLKAKAVTSNCDESDVAKVINSATQCALATSHLVTCAKVVAPTINNATCQLQLTEAYKEVSRAVERVSNVCETSVKDDNLKRELQEASLIVTKALEDLLSHIRLVSKRKTVQIKEVDIAIKNVQTMKPLLNNTMHPHNNSSYFDCLDAIMNLSSKLASSMTAIGRHTESGDLESFEESVKESSNSISGLVEHGAQSAYLVGAADPSSIAGRPGLVDINAFHKANDTIQSACKQLTNRNSNQQQILNAATVIAKHTSSLCDSCRSASSKTTNATVKRQFVQSAKDVANATAILVKEIKALDLDPQNENNRQSCASATRPLIDALENLIKFASTPDFCGIPARISEKAKLAQQPIIISSKQIVENYCSMLNTAKSLFQYSKDPTGWTSLANHSRNVGESIKSLVTSIKDASPGQKECDITIEKLRKNIKELDQSSFSLNSQTLRPRRDLPIKTLREKMHTILNDISDKIDPVRVTGKCEAENIGHSVTSLSSHFDALVSTVISCAAKAGSPKVQTNLIDQTKTICECALQLVYTVKECGGNPKATSVHTDIDDACEALREAIQDLTHTLQTSGNETHVSGIIDTLTKSITRIDERVSFTSSEMVSRSSSFVDYQTQMVNNLREITRCAQEISSKSITQVDQLGPLVNSLSGNYSTLASDTTGATTLTNNIDIASRIRSSVQDLGNACVQLTRSVGIVQNDPEDAVAQRQVSDNAKLVSEKATFVLSALQAGSRGTQVCINACSTVSGIIGDLETTIMFATAGTLNPENEGDVFSVYRENILKSAKALVDDTKSLIAGAASNQEQLADAAQNAVTTIVQLSETVKLGAGSLSATNSQAQILLLNAVKDVASALGDLVQATKAASGKNTDDPAMITMNESAKVMILNVTSLLKTVKIVEDEHQRGTRALEATIEAIAQEIRAFDSTDPPTKNSSPEDLIRAAKPVTLATAKAVAAGTSGKQDDIIVAANMGRKAIYDLLVTTKQAAHGAETTELTQRILATGRNCAQKYRQLLQLVHSCIQKSSGASADEKQSLMEMSRSIASSVTEIVGNSEMLKGSDWIDPDDPTVIAETELLGAASSIDAAAKKLASLQPRRTSIKITEDDQELNFDQLILDAAKSITTATSSLVRAASAAQRELVTSGKVASRPVSTSDDGQWSEGLISAARHVAAATHSLVEAANALVQGCASEEKLISSAKQVASSTAQLLVACKVKADPNFRSMGRLQEAGNAVKRATDNLVKASQQAIEHEEDQSLVISKRKVPGIAQEILAREEILKKERELTDAREKLAAIRKAKYNNKIKNGDGDTETNGDYHLTASATITSTVTTTTTNRTVSPS